MYRYRLNGKTHETERQTLQAWELIVAVWNDPSYRLWDCQKDCALHPRTLIVLEEETVLAFETFPPCTF